MGDGSALSGSQAKTTAPARLTWPLGNLRGLIRVRKDGAKMKTRMNASQSQRSDKRASQTETRFGWRMSAQCRPLKSPPVLTGASNIEEIMAILPSL